MFMCFLGLGVCGLHVYAEDVATIFYEKDKGPNEIDWKLLRDHLHREGRVLAEHALEIIRRMGELLRSLAF